MLCHTLFSAAALVLFTRTHGHARSLPTESHVLDLKRTNTKAISSKLLLPERAATGTAPFILAAEGLGYAVDIVFGTQTFSVLFDTGSSDLWLPTSNFVCVDEFGDEVDVAECGFGPLFDGTFSDGSIADENFNITYGDGEFLTGTLGYEDITLAGVTVNSQEVALVDYGYWFGDNDVSGLMGFAYPTLTSAYHGTDPTLNNVNLTAAPYNPFFFNAVQQGNIDSFFSIAIERSTATDGPGGQLAIGGLPTIDFNNTFTSTPLEIIQLNRNAASATNFSYYTICPEGFTFAPAKNSSSSKPHSKFLGLQNLRGAGSLGARQTDPYHADRIPIIVDSGTTLNYLPSDITSAVNAAFNPPSYYSNLYGLYLNKCNAIPPDFAVRINGQDFYISTQDMLVPPGGASGRDFCISAIQHSLKVFVLGDAFLKNVVAVFDVGQSEMRFAPHMDY